MAPISRRDFIVKSGLTAVSLSVFGCVVPKANANNTFVGDCKTTDDILGPFYRPKAPLRADLTMPDQEGIIINLSGTVYSDDCSTPVESALVEIWQADLSGNYDNDSDAFRYRARWKVDKDGKYAFKTMIPGRYLNGGQYRPAHIHYRVSSLDHQELVSQIYFKDDPYIDKDPWASKSKARKRILPVVDQGNGIHAVQFDVFLAKNT